MKKKREVLQKLFLSTLYLSAFTFGGGYVIVTLMKKKFVDEYHWIEEDEMLDLIAIAQSAPGAIAVNGAIVVGFKLAGVTGALTAIIATIIPPFVIISLVSVFYQAFRSNFFVSQMLEGMQAGVGAVIASVVYEMAAGVVHGKNLTSLLIMAGAFAATCIFNVNVVAVILVCILLESSEPLRRKGGRRNDLLEAVFKLSSDWDVQLRRRLCGDAADTGAGCDVSRLAQYGRVYGFDYYFPDDAGPIAVNSATFVGIKIAGIPGALAATIGCILPSCIIVTLIACLYLKYRNMAILQGVLASLRPAVVAMIASAGISILISAFWGGAGNIALSDTNWIMVLIFAACVVMLQKFKMNPITVMLAAGVFKVVTALALG